MGKAVIPFKRPRLVEEKEDESSQKDESSKRDESSKKSESPRRTRRRRALTRVTLNTNTD